MNPYGEDFANLKDAVSWSISQLEKPRKERVNAVKQYVGSHYADEGSEKNVPVNLLEMAVCIYTRLLAVRAPQVMVNTEVPQLRRPAKEMEIALNQVPEEVGMAETLRSAITEALFSVGIIKVGISTTDYVMGHAYGEPFVDLVTLDDYFCDMSAKSYKQIQFEGNDYWRRLDDVLNSPHFPEEPKKDLTSDEHTTVGENGQERAETISQDEGASTYQKMVKLRDVWLPHEQRLITYVPSQDKILSVVDWDGPENGPYHRLSFRDVPGNIMPLPPAQLWRDLHELANALFRKLSKQADSHKRVLAFGGNDNEAIKQFKEAKDGDGIQWQGQQPGQLEASGIDQANLAFFLQTRDLYSYFAGNLDSLGGLAPQAETLGQEELLSNASSTRLQEMRQAVVETVKGVYKHLAWYEWTDPIRTRKITKKVPRSDITIQTVWSAATREGDFLDYNFDIDVHSMEDNSPEKQLQKLNMVAQNYILPLLPLVQKQGGQIDIEALFNLIGEYSNLPELGQILKFKEAIPDPDEQVQGEAPHLQGGGGGETSAQPAQTTRTYRRENVPGASRSGNERAMTELLMGGDKQQSEKDSLFRSTK